jgi:hypothetical protein
MKPTQQQIQHNKHTAPIKNNKTMVVVRFNKRRHAARTISGVILVVLIFVFWISMYLMHSDEISPRQDNDQGKRILYVITSSNEFNTGDKKTKEGQDRFMEIMVPVLLDGVETMVTDYHVDVYLILGYKLSHERQQLLQQQLPNGVGLEVWNEAKPANYDYISLGHRKAYLSEMDKILARQHRYVVKDKLPYYDFFLAFEDDMLITKTHIDYHISVMDELERYKTELDSQSHKLQKNDILPYGFARHDRWWGELTREQLDHIKPGFLRVEVQTNPQIETQRELGPLPVFKRARADPRICCHAKHVGLQGKLAPQYPTADQVMIWETSIPGLFVREMPSRPKQLLDWVALLPIKGTSNTVEGYWSGTNGALGSTILKKPASTVNHFIGQSAGWMASAQEVMDYENKLCHGGFLPPFDAPRYSLDGMGFMTDSVEYWSGGLQMWGQTCEIQRIVSLEPAQFSKHLIYHTANNKQIEKNREMLVKVQTLLGQLHSVKHAAQAEMLRRLGKEYLFSHFFRAIGLIS